MPWPSWSTQKMENVNFSSLVKLSIGKENCQRYNLQGAASTWALRPSRFCLDEGSDPLGPHEGLSDLAFQQNDTALQGPQ